jgi:membrane protein
MNGWAMTRPKNQKIRQAAPAAQQPFLSRAEYWSFLGATAVLAFFIARPSIARASLGRRPAENAFGAIRGANKQGIVQHERARESGRGRHASTPSQIPPRGWKDILLRVYKNVGEDRIILVAAGVTFYSLLAIFPAIAALVALYGLFADPANIASHLDAASGVLPGGALDVIRDQMNLVVSQGHAKLGLAFIIGFVVSLWSANAGMKSIFDALNLVYDEPEERGFIKVNLLSLVFTMAAIIFVLLAIGCIVALPAAFGSTGVGGAMALVAKIARWPILLMVIGLALVAIYRYGPSRSKPKWRWITWGSAFAAVGWIVVSILFSVYTTNFSDYNKTYGSLGAIIAFMFWLWLATTVILMGAEIDAEMEHQTVRDTTEGHHPKPLGARGATMADTVGAAQN